ncbi:MAG: preprotein translocase subunit YajC [Clostridiaceae bacterium]
MVNILAGATSSGTLSIVYIVGMFALLYFIIFLPERKRKKKFQSMLSEIAVNDEVVSKGGIIGKIVNIQDDYIILQTGPNNAKIKLNKNGIAVVNKKSDASEVEVKEVKEVK